MQIHRTQIYVDNRQLQGREQKQVNNCNIPIPRGVGWGKLRNCSAFGFATHLRWWRYHGRDFPPTPHVAGLKSSVATLDHLPARLDVFFVCVHTYTHKPLFYTKKYRRLHPKASYTAEENLFVGGHMQSNNPSRRERAQQATQQQPLGGFENHLSKTKKTPTFIGMQPDMECHPFCQRRLVRIELRPNYASDGRWHIVQQLRRVIKVISPPAKYASSCHLRSIFHHQPVLPTTSPNGAVPREHGESPSLVLRQWYW